MMITEQPETTTALQVSLPRETLYAGLAQVLKCASNNRFMPIISHVKLEAQEGTLTLATTNLGTGIVITLPAEVEYPGVWTISAKLLAVCVKSLPAKGTVRLVVEDDHLIVACGNRTFTLAQGTDGQDFPKMEISLSDGPCTLNSSDLIAGIKEVQFAAATDDSRPVFTAICLHFLGDHANLVGCDGFRVAVRSIPMEHSIQTQLLVPAPDMRLLSQLLPSGQPVTLSWNAEWVVFTCGGIRLISKLVDRTYPNYQQAFPRDHETTITLKKSSLTSMLAASKPFWRDSSNVLKVVYGGSGVTFTATSEDLGTFSEQVTTEVTGESDLALNAEYFWQFLKIVTGREVILLLNGPTSPCLIKPVGREDFCYTLMPMALIGI